MGADAITTDTELLALGLHKFEVEAEVKFIAGINEHNPNGDKHLCRLEPLQIVQQMKQEKAFGKCLCKTPIKKVSNHYWQT